MPSHTTTFVLALDLRICDYKMSNYNIPCYEDGMASDDVGEPLRET